jgi:hypothetical protein
LRPLYYISYVLIAWLGISGIYATDYKDFWVNTVRYENDSLTLDVPAEWQSLFKTKGIEHVYKVTGATGLPMNYAGGRVVASVFIWKNNAKDDDMAIRQLMDSKAKYSNKMYTEPYKVDGEPAILVSSYFDKYMNGFAAVRYDLMIYRESIKQYYVISFLVQYLQGKTDFLTNVAVRDYADEIYRHVGLKKS